MENDKQTALFTSFGGELCSLSLLVCKSLSRTWRGIMRRERERIAIDEPLFSLSLTVHAKGSKRGRESGSKRGEGERASASGRKKVARTDRIGFEVSRY